MPNVMAALEQAGFDVEVVAPGAGMPEQGGGGVNEYMRVSPGQVALALLAVVVLVVCVVVVMLWKFVAVVPLIPTEEDPELAAVP